MKVTFLGTGTSQGVPVIGCECEVCQSMDFHDKRLRASVFVQTGGKHFVIDTGPDFRQQMLREGIKKLDAVIFTHSHKDHTAGLDDVRAYNFRQDSFMPVYGDNHVLKQLRAEYYYAFEKDKYPGTPQLELIELDGEDFEISGIKIATLPVRHLRMPVLGFRIHDFSYITDANKIPAATVEKLKGTKVLVLNALQREPHISHFNLKEAVETAQEIGAEKTYFTHISHKLGLHKAVDKELPTGVALAWDGLQLSL